jgi:hypothetical protein
LINKPVKIKQKYVRKLHISLSKEEWMTTHERKISLEYNKLDRLFQLKGFRESVMSSWILKGPFSRKRPWIWKWNKTEKLINTNHTRLLKFYLIQPIMELHPGPPFNQTTNGSVEGEFCDSNNQKNSSPSWFESTVMYLWKIMKKWDY